MTTVLVPTRAPSDLGVALTNTRAPQANELSAVNMEKIKDHLIDHANAINTNALLTIATLTGTSATVANADSGKTIRCTAATTVSITVPTGLTPGSTIEYLQEGAGQVQIVAGGGLTLRHSSDFNPYTADQWSSLVVTVLDTDEALVRGDLAPV